LPASRTPPSLNARLLAAIALLAAAAVLVAVSSVLVYATGPETPNGPALLGVLIAADVCVFVLFGAYQLRRLVTSPLEDAVAAAEAIAAGDLRRRVPEAATREFGALAASVNRMTDHLLAAQVQRRASPPRSATRSAPSTGTRTCSARGRATTRRPARRSPASSARARGSTASSGR
jgi:HAMP domain-containing protein